MLFGRLIVFRLSKNKKENILSFFTVPDAAVLHQITRPEK
jgi:hypothetical protein